MISAQGSISNRRKCHDAAAIIIQLLLFVRSTLSAAIISPIPADYIKEIPPKPPSKGAIQVQIALFITDVNSIDVKDMDFRVDLMFRQTWTDNRLNPEAVMDPSYNYTVLSSTLLNQIWQPDPIIVNSKKTDVASMVDKFGSLIIFRDKKITYTTKLSVLLSCQMDFKHYPYDVQHCPLYIESFGGNKDELQLAWEKFECPNETTAENYSDVDGFCSAVGITSQLKLLQFELNTNIPFSVEDVEKVYGRGKAKFTRLVLSFEFTRVLTQYVVQTFVPSIFIICLAWFSFFMGMDSVPGRVTLLVTSQLTLVTMFASSLSAAIPPVSYLKAIDYWMLACLFFIFLAQIEFVVAKILDVMYRYEKTGTYYGQAGMSSKPSSAEDDEDGYSRHQNHRGLDEYDEDGRRHSRKGRNNNQQRQRNNFNNHNDGGRRHRGTESRQSNNMGFTKFGSYDGDAASREVKAARTPSASSLGMFTRFQQHLASLAASKGLRGGGPGVGRGGSGARTNNNPDRRHQSVMMSGMAGSVDSNNSTPSRWPTSEDAMTVDTDVERGLSAGTTTSMDNNPPGTRRVQVKSRSTARHHREEEEEDDDDDILSLKLAWVDEDGDERILWLEMDIVFRVVFPILYIIFNAIFWPLFFTRSF